MATVNSWLHAYLNGQVKISTILESHIEPTIDRPFNAAHIIDDNAILQGLTAIPVTFEEQVESIFNQSPKAKHVGLVTDA